MRWLGSSLVLAAVAVACSSSSSSPSSLAGAACASAGGACVLGDASCATEAAANAQDCNPPPVNPGGAFCCLTLGDAGGGASDASSDATDSASVDADGAVDPCGSLSASWTRCAANPLAKAGFQQPDGRYELSIGDPDVQFDVTDQLWRAWWSTGLDASYSDPNPQLGIKYAQSADGVAWTIQPTVTIATRPQTTDWDTLKLETPSVLILPSNPADRRYLLFYSGAGIDKTVNGTSIPWYQIGVAFSADGTSFTRLPEAESPYAGMTTPYGNVEGLVLLGRDAFPGMTGVADGSVADPEIVFDGTTLHLFFSSLAVDSTGAPLAFGISHATSTDGIHWTPQSGNPLAALNGGKGPSVVAVPGGGWELFFQRDTAADIAEVPTTFNPQLGIWRATSPDLTQFTVDNSARNLTWDGSYATEKYGWIAVGDMTLVSGEHRYYYPAFSGLTPPASDWVVPLQNGVYAPSLIVLDMARRAP